MSWRKATFQGLYNPSASETAPKFLTLKIDRNYFILGDKERYLANNQGGLSLAEGPIGLKTGAASETPRPTYFCTGQNTGPIRVGQYRWSLLGRYLTITKVSDKKCADRAQLVPGTWVRVGAPAPKR